MRAILKRGQIVFATLLMLGGAILVTVLTVAGTSSTSNAAELVAEVSALRLKADYVQARAKAAEYSQAYSSDPLVRQAMEYELAACDYGEGNKAEALRRFEALLAEDAYVDLPAEDPAFRVDDALYFKAVIAEQQAGDAGAVTIYQQVWTRFPAADRADDAMLRAAGAYQRLGQDGDSIETYSNLIAHYPGTPQAAESQFFLAGLYRKQQRFSEAVTLLQAAAQTEFRYQVDSIWYEGKTHIDLGDYAAAVSCFERIIREHPEFRHAVDVKSEAGLAYARLGRVDEALALYQGLVAESLGTENAPQVVRRVNQALMQMDGDLYKPTDPDHKKVQFDRLSDIESNLDRLIERHGESQACAASVLDVVNYCVHPAWIKLARGGAMREKVISLTDRLIASYPDSPEIWAARIENALALAPTDPAEAKKRMQQAVDDARATGDPIQTSGTLFNLGVLLSNLGDHEPACAAYEECLKYELSPLFHSEVRLCLASARNRQGRYEEAWQEFAAIATNTEYPADVRALALFSQACSMKKAGRKSDARVLIDTLIEQFPGAPAAARAVEMKFSF